MEKVTSLLPEGYSAPCILLIRGLASTKFEKPELLNGFDSGEENMVTKLADRDKSLKEALYDKFSNIVLRYNYPSSELFTTSRFLAPRPITEDQAHALLGFVQDEWMQSRAFDRLTVGEEEGIEVDIDPQEDEIGIVILPIEIPENLLWLGTIFDTSEKQMMYEDFLDNPIIYKRLRKMCDNKGITLDPEVDCTAALPIHQSEKNTGEILISTTGYEAFRQFQFCQNFLRGFDKNTAEFDLGKLMLLDPKFCEAMMTTTEMKMEGKEIHDEEGNYQRDLNQAIKRLEKNSEALKLYENNLIDPVALTDNKA
jgi:hypothetical protein